MDQIIAEKHQTNIQGNAYWPPSGSIEVALGLLEDRLNHIRERGDPDILIVGDMNIDVCSKNATVSKYKKLSQGPSSRSTDWLSNQSNEHL